MSKNFNFSASLEKCPFMSQLLVGGDGVTLCTYFNYDMWIY